MGRVKNSISKVLIANRGEIAIRIQRACDALGIASLCVASEADREALFARQAHELFVIGPAPASESYLVIDKLLAVAKERGCDAVHPGYGFLSENADFARRVEQAGMVFIGPTPEQIALLGSKTEARARVQQAGVPVTPGTFGRRSDEELLAAAQEIGFPIIIKAVAGGGGRGMRVAHTLEEMRALLPRARAEALKNFADEAVFIERYIANPRHVEVQVFGDSHGNVLHFGTRDCSTQRRHQKLVEEAPAPMLSPALREAIHQAAVAAARSVGYRNAGTAEFLVDGEQFYFLEMNTRIQVEHPVTEMVTGIDLVELQLRVARGEPLPLTQNQVQFTGHAIEFRIYGEDPEQQFAPVRGTIQCLERPTAPWIREDFGFVAGDQLQLYYDALLSKLIVHGASRDEAISRAYEALRRYQLKGVASTLPFHRWLLRLSPFRDAPLAISFIDQHFSSQSLEALRHSEVRDPSHRVVPGGEVIEQIHCTSSTYGYRIAVRVVHEACGDILAVPCDESGQAAVASFCRRSNGLRAALAALQREVLDEVPYEKLFARGAQ